MSDLTRIEKIKLENLFGMNSGYVLDFTNKTFSDLIYETTRVDIYDEKYSYESGSKANRLRAFWKEESNYRAGKVTTAILDVYLANCQVREGQVPYDYWDLYDECRQIATRLLSDAPVTEIDAIDDSTGDVDFDFLGKQIKESIEKNEPQAALDRLHTYVIRFIRQLCEKHNIEYTRAESLNAIFGKYVRFLVGHDAFESKMAEKILKFSIQVLDAFNSVRNDQSLAHDNQILNYSESLLIFNNVTNSIKFIQTLEAVVFGERVGKHSEDLNMTDLDEGDLPF